MSARFLSVAAGVCVVLGLAFGGLNTVQAVEFITNGGFEQGVINGSGPDKGPQTAEPWTWWGGGGHQDPYDQGRNPNPSVDANNPSANSWCNFGNPAYVNVASHHTWHFPPTTGMWVVPGATFRVQAQYYIPTLVHNYTSGLDEPNLPAAMTEARAGVYLSMSGGYDTQLLLDPRYPGDPASSITTYDQWVSYDLNWTLDPAYTTAGQVSYPSFRIFGGDGTNISGGLNPGGYFDNLQITSDDYRGDLHGFVKDIFGNPLEGAIVTLRSPFYDYDAMTPEQIEANAGMDVVTTAADGSYTLPTWAPHGYEFSVDATYDDPYTSDGPHLLTVSSTAGLFPQITMSPPHIPITWTNGSNDDQWENGANWSYVAEPNAISLCTIDNGDDVELSLAGELAFGIELGATTATSLNIGGDLTVSETVNVHANGTLIVDGTLDAIGSVDVNGTLTVNGTLNSGATSVDGTLAGTGTISASIAGEPDAIEVIGTISPAGLGGRGVLTLGVGEMSLEGVFEAQVNAQVGQTASDQIFVSDDGMLELGGTLKISGTGRTTYDNFEPKAVRRVVDNPGNGAIGIGDIVNHTGESFAEIEPAVPVSDDDISHVGQGAFLRDVEYKTFAVGFENIIAVDIELFIAKGGDTDGDGKVWLQDWLNFRPNFDSTGTEGLDWTDGDFDGDGRVWLSDWLIFRPSFSSTPYHVFTAAAQAVPEPCTAAILLVTGLVGLAVWRRRK